MSHTNKIKDTETHFVIDPLSRVITNSLAVNNTIVQYDHNSERFTFEMPRYVDGHDMLESTIVRIHYRNSASTGLMKTNGIYTPDDLAVSDEDENTITFSWLLSSATSQYIGFLYFSVQFLCLEDETIVYAWNTSIYKDVVIAESINNSEEVVAEINDALISATDDLKLELKKYGRGVYVGSGEMPGECNVQVDPSGDATFEVSGTVTSVNGVEPDENGDVFLYGKIPAGTVVAEEAAVLDSAGQGYIYAQLFTLNRHTLAKGKSYTVVLNGTTYPCAETGLEADTPIGSFPLYSIQRDGTPIGMFGYVNTGGAIQLYDNSGFALGDTVSVKITLDEDIVKKIPAEHLDIEVGGGAVATVNGTKPDESGNVFLYGEQTETISVVDETVTVVQVGNDIGAFIQTMDHSVFVENATFDVAINGVNYMGICSSQAPSTNADGSPPMLIMDTSNQVMAMVGFMAGMGNGIFFSGLSVTVGESMPLRITKTVETVQKIPAKYLESPSVDEVKALIDEYIEEALGGEY